MRASRRARGWRSALDGASSDTALVAEIETFAAEVRARYQDFILVGIGGSSLGAIATVQALTHPFRNVLP